jgi:hypothetical protein
MEECLYLTPHTWLESIKKRCISCYIEVLLYVDYRLASGLSVYWNTTINVSFFVYLTRFCVSHVFWMYCTNCETTIYHTLHIFYVMYFKNPSFAPLLIYLSFILWGHIILRQAVPEFGKMRENVFIWVIVMSSLFLSVSYLCGRKRITTFCWQILQDNTLTLCVKDHWSCNYNSTFG